MEKSISRNTGHNSTLRSEHMDNHNECIGDKKQRCILTIYLILNKNYKLPNCLKEY